MDYLAHFSTVEGDDRNGSFSMLVSAIDIDTAVEKFKDKILDTKGEGDILNSVDKVFLEVIIQINKMPNEASITLYESRSNDHFGCISISPVDEDSLEAFNWHPDDEGDIDFDEKHEVHPFVEFEEEKV